MTISIDYTNLGKQWPYAFLNFRHRVAHQHRTISSSVTKSLLHLSHSSTSVVQNSTSSFFGTTVGEHHSQHILEGGDILVKQQCSSHHDKPQSILNEALSTPSNILLAHPRNLFAPPLGAEYELNVRLPVIGPQIFQLKILSNKKGKLVVSGALQIDDEVEYSIDKSSGELSFTLSDGTKEVLRRFRTRLVSVNYCAKTDTPHVRVRPPLPVNIDLKLKRKHKI